MTNVISNATSSEPISILLVDDHPMIRLGLRQIIEDEPLFLLAGEAENGRVAVEKFELLRPDLVLMDLNMPEMDGMEAIRRIRAIAPKAHVVILTSLDGEEDVFRGLKAGARGYLLKDAPASQIAECILTVTHGNKYVSPYMAGKLAARVDHDALSERELEILQWLSEGKSNKEIARLALVTEGTVKFHVNNILFKMSAATRTGAVVNGLKRALITLH
ncbi:response regulator [Herbaspirillum rhizosphaerae]|uniref:response regulator n=1 Tax=Herbaspirillum rhizosphaerae TaxID=346179 RepID=UPI00067B495B|nr:response regulator transcription factor [Herbaspirillum rhizosphaerae]